MKKLQLIIALALPLFLLIGLAPGAWATVYYVAESAAGTEDGLTYANRMSVALHNADTFSGDDLIYLCGTVTSEIVPPSDGTEGHRIIYDGDCSSQGGADCTIDRGGTGYGFDLVDYDDANVCIGIDPRSHLEIRNFTIIDVFVGIVLWDGVHDIYIHDNVIGGDSNDEDIGGDGIFMTFQDCGTTLVDSITIEDNTIINAGDVEGEMSIRCYNATNVIIRGNEISVTDTFGTRTVDLIMIGGTGPILVEDNYLHGTATTPVGEDGIDCKLGAQNVTIKNNVIEYIKQAGVQVENNADLITIHGNYFKDCDWGGILVYGRAEALNYDWDSTDGVTNVTASCNIIENCGTSDDGVRGIGVYTDEEDIINIKLYNNVVYKSGNPGGTWSQTGVFWGHCDSGCEFSNNILMDNYGDQSYLQLSFNANEDIECKNNAFYHSSGATLIRFAGSYYTLANWEAADNQATGNQEGDPLFVDAANGDFHLKNGSPCTSAGTDLGDGSLYLDFEGNNQDDWGTGWEMGAYVRKPELSSVNQTGGGL